VAEISEEKLSELLNKAAETATAKAIEEFKKVNQPKEDDKSKKDKDEKDNKILEQIEQEKQEKAKKNAEYEEIKAATTFNVGFENFKKENTKYLPPETDSIVNTIKSQNFDKSKAAFAYIQFSYLSGKII
jgi:hypothetical protein